MDVILFFALPFASILAMCFVMSTVQKSKAVAAGPGTTVQNDYRTASQVFALAFLVLSSSLSTGVLVQILYGRPDTWGFAVFLVFFFTAAFVMFTHPGGEMTITDERGRVKVDPESTRRFNDATRTRKPIFATAMLVAWMVLFARLALLGALGDMTEAPEGFIPACAYTGSCNDDD